jgi:hypothetical protein
MLSGLETLFQLVAETLRWCRFTFRSSRSIKAENLFLRRQLALYVERGVKPQRIDPLTRIALTLLSRLFSWQDALVVVRPETMIRWHRAGWKLFWRLKSRPGRPPHPSKSQSTPSPGRIVFGPCQIDPRRIASRILPRAFLCVTEFLRTTVLRCCDDELGRGHLSI